MDDVQFLKHNSEKESYMFVIDSDTRDKIIHPNPNFYSIRFNTPFKNVYSMEVLDASIPRTQYLINYDNNTLKYNINSGPFQTITLDIGDYTMLDMMDTLNSKFNSQITVENVSFPSEKRNQYVFRSNNQFSFDFSNTHIGDILGFDENNNAVQNPSTFSPGIHSRIFHSVIEPNTTNNYLIPPGIYSFVGDRYVLLKCKEIEDHLFHSRSFEKYTLGLAKFKLSVVGYGDERFDFTALPAREFHPIGKLEYLSFRFERPNGQLYDFRGMNHTLTIIIRYYVTRSNFDFQSKLNPSYNPNYHEWYVQDSYNKRLLQREEELNNSDSSDESESSND